MQTVTRRNTKSTTPRWVVFHWLDHGIDNNDGDVGGGQGIENVSEVSDIWGQGRRLRDWGIGEHNGGVGRGRWAQGFDNDNVGVNRVSRRYNASKWTSLTAKAPVHLRAQGIDKNAGIVGRVRRACGLSDDNGGIDIGRVIYDASEGSETTEEASGAIWQDQGIYNYGGGVDRGRWARRQQQRQRQWMRWRRTDDASMGSEMMTEAAADLWQARWIGNDNRVLISIAIGLLTVTLSRLCLFAILFLYCFHQIPFPPFASRDTISTAIIRKIFLYQLYTNLAYAPLTYRRVKKLRVIMIYKDVRKPLAHKKGNEILIRIWNDYCINAQTESSFNILINQKK